ncbi:MAG TPA: hypothetical protein VD905_02400 [Flavobacteriales bacterium]|nr:hypothetical protein [Flavobacteriales bacterium]
MPDYLKDYVDYYRVRMNRYEHDPDYKNSYQSEKAIYEAIAGCNELKQFRERLGNLNGLNAVALSRDEYKIRYNHYRDIKETIRAKGPERILARADQYNEVFNLMTMIGEEENKNMIEISMDDVSLLRNAWFLIDQIEIYETAEVPSNYKMQRQQYANELKANLKESYDNHTSEMRKWQPDWTFNPELVWEERHRRLFPYSDEHIHEKINQYKSILNLK